MKSEPKRSEWTKGHVQIGFFIRTRDGGTIKFVNNNLDTPGAREEIRGILSPFLGEELWPEVIPASAGVGGALRPHSIEGWWQVWSGNICVALIKPEDLVQVILSGKVPKVWIDEDNDEGPEYKWHVIVDTAVVGKYGSQLQAEQTAEVVRNSFSQVKKEEAPKKAAKKEILRSRALQCEECGKPASATYWDPDGKKMEAVFCQKHEKVFRAESAKQVEALRELKAGAKKLKAEAKIKKAVKKAVKSVGWPSAALKKKRPVTSKRKPAAPKARRQSRGTAG